jgi:hypothetical protein
MKDIFYAPKTSVIRAFGLSLNHCEKDKEEQVLDSFATTQFSLTRLDRMFIMGD